MSNTKKKYICIDLKSFYASVECRDRNLDPLTTNLVVADSSRTEKTICLAVSPSLKSYGIKGRPRLFEVVQKVKEINYNRARYVKGYKLNGSSSNKYELDKNKELTLDYIIATPQMAKYIEYSTKIYNVYLKYIAPEDIHVYSIDEVFMDVSKYLSTYKMTPKELARKIIQDVLSETGITATAGIGDNMYLAKIAMDIVAKHIPPDKDGVRIASLTEMEYRKQLWDHKPLTDFWRLGIGYEKRLEKLNLHTMGEIARCSLENEDILFDEFGINAELLIDHAWGYEPCQMKDIKNYKSDNNSLGTGQVLHCAYDYEKTKLILKEMVDLLALDLVDRHLVTDQMILSISYDIENLTNQEIASKYKGEITIDSYGRKVPKGAHGSICLDEFTSSSKELTKATLELYERIINPSLLIRKVNIAANHVLLEELAPKKKSYEQLNLFTDYSNVKQKEEIKKQELKKEKKTQEVILNIKKKYGKNAILKGMNLEEGATAKERNEQIGGHKA